MKIKFWGVRGSIPTPLSDEQIKLKLYKILYLYNKSKFYKTKNIKDFLKEQPIHANSTYGGNTACVEINCNDELIIIDAGSGIRALGLDLLKRSKSYKIIHILISHTHWDHICGFPFFVPAYITGKNIKIYSPFSDIEERVKYQQDAKYFPLELNKMASNIEFIPLEKNNSFSINNIKITNFAQNHPGDSYGFSIEYNNKKCVYSSDNEILNTDYKFIQDYEVFVKNADILIFDAQYTLEETVEKLTWGHSSYTMGVELALRAHAKNVIFFHYEPRNSDEVMFNHLQRINKFFKVIKHNYDPSVAKNLKIMNSYEGLTLNI